MTTYKYFPRTPAIESMSYTEILKLYEITKVDYLIIEPNIQVQVLNHKLITIYLDLGFEFFDQNTQKVMTIK